MIFLGHRYVRYINKRYRRTGTLWGSRYKSSIVQAKVSLLQCQRYIEFNPVRAAMVDDPTHYRWSSYRANALGQSDSLLVPHPDYTGMAATDSDRFAAYRASRKIATTCSSHLFKLFLFASLPYAGAVPVCLVEFPASILLGV